MLTTAAPQSLQPPSSSAESPEHDGRCVNMCIAISIAKCTDMRWAYATAPLVSSRRGGHSEYRHISTYGLDMPSAMPICMHMLSVPSTPQSLQHSSSSVRLPEDDAEPAGCTMCVGIDMCIDMYAQKCAQACHKRTLSHRHAHGHVYIDMCIDTCIDMRTDMCIDIYRHVRRLVYRHGISDTERASATMCIGMRVEMYRHI